MFVNKDELLRLIQLHQAYVANYLGKEEAVHSYYAGVVEAFSTMKEWLETVEAIEGPKRKRRAKANG